MSRLSPLSYDSWKTCAPEDDLGYYEEPPAPMSEAEEQARKLMAAANVATAALQHLLRPEIHLGYRLPESVVQEVCRLACVAVRGHVYAPSGPRGVLVVGRTDVAPIWIYAFKYKDRGVEVYGQGDRPATEAEIAAVTK